MSGCVHLICEYVYIYIVSSPYLFVFGDDRVIRYTKADDVACSVGEA